MEVTYSSAVGAGLRETLTSTAGIEAVKGMVLLATPHAELLSTEFESVLANLEVPVFGGIFPEIFHDGERKDTGAVVVSLFTEPFVTTVSDLSDPDTNHRESLDPNVPTNYETAFVFVDAYATGIDSIIDSLFRTYSVALDFIGGGAGTLDDDHGPCLFTNKGVIEDAAVIAAINQPITVGVKHGWKEIDGPFRVTDATGSTIETLDGKPAFSIYRDIIEEAAGRTITKENFFEVAKSYPFGITRMDAEQIVRDPFSVDADGSITCFGTVSEGEFVAILEANPRSLINAARTASATARRGSSADMLVFFDCISRVLYLEDEFDRELAAVTPEERPLFGALTIGEIANDGSGHLDYYTKTAVVGALEDV